MRTTLVLDDDLLRRAMLATGIVQKTAVIRAGLESLLRTKARQELASLGGTAPDFVLPRRRRTTRQP